MDIFLKKTDHFTSEGLYKSSEAVWVTFMMDGSTFWASNSKSPFIITIIKFGGGINDGIIAIFG